MKLFWMTAVMLIHVLIHLLKSKECRGLPRWLRGKESTCNAGDESLILDQKDLLEEGMAAHSRIRAWRVPWPEEPGGLQPTGLQRVGRD